MDFLGFFLVAAAYSLTTCTSQVVPNYRGIYLPVQQVAPPSPYSFGFDASDGLGMSQRRHETSDGSGIVEGWYSLGNNGLQRIVSYKADGAGFRAKIKSNEPGMANSSPADAEFVVEPPPPQAVLQSLWFPVQNTL